MKHAPTLLLIVAFATAPIAAVGQISFTFTTSDVPGSTLNRPHGINDAGDIVGLYFDAGEVGHGYLLRNALYHTIDVPRASFTSAREINNFGVIDGEWVDQSGVTDHGFLD